MLCRDEKLTNNTQNGDEFNGMFQQGNVYKDRSNSKFGVYWFHILVCMGTSTNSFTHLFLARISSWIHAFYLAGLHSEKASVHDLDTPDFFCFKVV